MTKKSTKSKLISSLLVLALCVTAFAGSTYAWFTDEVVSSGNKIQAGRLDIELYQLATTIEELGSQTVGADGYVNISKSEAPIFNYDKWEPGYTDVNILKVKNEGNLALTWSADLIARGSVSEFLDDSQPKISDVIDVYVTTDADKLTAKPADFATIKSDWTKIGTLTDFILGTDTVKSFSEATKGVLLSENSEAPLGLALHMQEEADDRYQNKSLTGTFDVLIYAQQYTKEADSFNNQYDADATVLPYAGVSELPLVEEEILNVGSLSETTDVFDAAYVFMATENVGELTNNPYADWIADFVVSFDKDVKEGQVMLAGKYDAFTMFGERWLGFVLEDPNNKIPEILVTGAGGEKLLEAGKEIRLLKDMPKAYNFNNNIVVDYADVCTFQQFKCAAKALAPEMVGTTMTVELRLYETCDACRAGVCNINAGKHVAYGTRSENVETGNSVLVATYTHKFQ